MGTPVSNLRPLLLLPEAFVELFSFSLQYAFSPQLVLPERFGLAALEQYDGIEDPGNFHKNNQQRQGVTFVHVNKVI